MNKKQESAAYRLEKALIAAGKAGLCGGVYSGVFCIWPKNQHPEHNRNFFENVEHCGGAKLITLEINLDGGAGV